MSKQNGSSTEARELYASLVGAPVGVVDETLSRIERETPALAAEVRSLLDAEPKPVSFSEAPTETRGDSAPLSTQQRQRADRILHDLLDVPAYRRLEAAKERCRDDAALLEEVLSLLEGVDQQAASELTASTPRSRAESVPAFELPGYEFLRTIGSGGFGDVWVARRAAGGVRVVKVVSRAQALEHKGLSALEAATGEHPHLVPIQQVVEVDGRLSIVMPLADPAQDGPGVALNVDAYKPFTLDTLLERRGRLGLREACAIAASIALAIDHLHEKGAAHLDVKPANILRFDGVWKLGDYSLVSTIGEGGVGGFTAGYCPPEFLGDRRADLYALGVTLFQLLTGGKPADLETFRAGRIRLPGDPVRRRLIRQVILRLTSTGDDQYGTAGQAARALRRAMRLPGHALVASLIGAFVIWQLALNLGPAPAVEESATGQTAAAAPLTIEPLSIGVFRDVDGDGEDEKIGVYGVSARDARLNDSLSLSTTLSAPAHCFLIALNPPDGAPQLLFPGGADIPPPPTDFVDAPMLGEARVLFGLTDGVGTQAFVLVASEDPLPAYDVWLTEGRVEELLARYQAASTPLSLAWRSDGRALEPLFAQRGELRARPEDAESLRAVAGALRETLGVRVESVAIPVLPPEPPVKDDR